MAGSICAELSPRETFKVIIEDSVILNYSQLPKNEQKKKQEDSDSMKVLLDTSTQMICKETPNKY